MTDEERKKRKREYDKEYRAKNKERIAQCKREWYEKNREHKQEYDKEYRAKTTKKRKKVKKKWNKENKKHMSEYNKNYYNTLDGLAKRRRNHYLAEDKHRNFDFGQTVSALWIKENILNSKCIYCGDCEPSHLGCDRIDNSIGHTEDNIVCSCAVCNWEREIEGLTVEEFIEYRKTHPRFKTDLKDKIDRLTGMKKPPKPKYVKRAPQNNI